MTKPVHKCKCGEFYQEHESGLCRNCRNKKHNRDRANLSRGSRRENALYRHARLVYDYDRDFPGEF